MSHGASGAERDQIPIRLTDSARARLRFSGARARTAILGGVAMATLTMISAALLIWNDRQAQIREWQRSIAIISTMVAAHAEETVRAADLVLESIQDMVREAHAQDDEDLRGILGTRSVHDVLRDKVSGLPQIDVATIVAANGDVVNFSRAYPPPPINLADRDYIQALTAGPFSGVFLSAPVLNRGTGEWTFYLARQIAGPGGKPLGVVIIGMSSRFFESFYKAANVGHYSAISLFRDDGTLLAREPPAAGAIGQSFKDEPAFRDVLPDGAAMAVTSRSRLPGISAKLLRVVAPRRVSDYALVTSVSVTDDVILAGWRHTAVNVTLLTAGLTMALLALALLLARLFERQDRTVRDLVRARMEAEAAAAANSALLAELRTSEARLGEQSSLLGVTLDHMNQGLMMVAADRSVPVCNRRAIELLDLPPALMASKPAFSAVVDHQRSIGEFVTNTVRADHMPGGAIVMTRAQTYERTRPNGTILEIQTIPLAGGGMVRTFTDITERRKSEEQVRYFAHHDGLTKLVNRLVFQERLEDALKLADRSARSIAVLYLDLDGFKQVNDAYGHAVGDRLLIEVSSRLRRMIRDVDTVARMGGDEFAIIQPLVERPDSTEVLARRILRSVAEPYAIGDLQCVVGLSIGIALYPDHATTAEELQQDADMALYRAKANGKGTWCMFDALTDGRQQTMFQLEQALKRALPEDQFLIEYQPIVDSGTRTMTAFEALLRWRHPERGLIGPGQFIDLAERSGIIVPIGLWVLETACAEAAGWPDELGLSVNLSPRQFSRGELPAQVSAILDRTGLAPHRLNLEVTEGVLIEDTIGVLDAMTRLRAMGVRFSLDDFGTAHSGLNYLRRFPFDVIKIDRSFIQDVVEQQEARTIVEAILAIGAAFHLSVVAEGVETEAQLRLLREMGCGLVQGFLTGRPVPGTLLGLVLEADG